MSKFWQKKYTSKYTGAEIDAAVAKAGNLPATTSADAGKALVVDDEGKIVAGEAGGGVIDGDYKPDASRKSFSDLLGELVAASSASASDSGYVSTDTDFGDEYFKNSLIAGKRNIRGTITTSIGAFTATIPYNVTFTNVRFYYEQEDERITGAAASGSIMETFPILGASMLNFIISDGTVQAAEAFFSKHSVI